MCWQPAGWCRLPSLNRQGWLWTATLFSVSLQPRMVKGSEATGLTDSWALVLEPPAGCPTKYSSMVVEQKALWLRREWQSPWANLVSEGPNSHMWVLTPTHTHTDGALSICVRESLTRTGSDKKSSLLSHCKQLQMLCAIKTSVLSSKA